MPPTVTVTGQASASVPTDRLQAWLRAEADNADPAAAASAVNTAMAKALARIKAFPGVKPTTSGYSTQQITEKGKPARWRVAQTLTLDAPISPRWQRSVASCRTRDGLLFQRHDVLAQRQRRAGDAEESLTQRGDQAWQERAQRRRRDLVSRSWHPGHVTVQTGDSRGRSR